MKWAGVAIVVAALAILVAWLLLRGDVRAPDAAAAAPSVASADAKGGAAKPDASRKAPVAASDAIAADAAAGPIPPPVDLDAVDRDRDLHGVVVRRDGTPVAGVRVQALFHPWRRGGGLNIEGGRLAVDGPETRTASDGTFAIHLDRGAIAELLVVADDFNWSVRTREHLAGERVRIVVDPGVHLRVTVVDESNRVVPGVCLTLSGRTGEDTTRTDAEGVARFTGLPASSHFEVELETPGWGDLGIREFVTDAGPFCEERLVLVKGRTLRGRVVDEASNSPIAKARVGIGWWGAHAVETDADGRYELPGWVGTNVREISVRAEGWAREEAEVGAREEIDFRLHRGFEAAGRVVDGNGSPVAGARIEIIASVHHDRHQRTSFGHATTGDDGRFRIGSLDPAMAHVLIVVADGLGRVRSPVAAPAAPKSVDLGDVVLRPGRLLAGRFVDADGKPIPGQWLVLEGPASSFGPAFEGNDYGAQQDLRTDDLGRFAFADLAPGDYVVRTEYDGSLQCETKATLTADRDLLDVELRLAPSTVVEVRVTDDHGEAVSDADVNAFSDDSQPVSARTDAQGVARLRVTWDEGEVFVNPPYGVTKRYIGCDSRDWKKGASSLSFVLREGAAIQGIVVDPEGKPLPRAFVRVEFDPRDGGARTTDVEAEGASDRWRSTDDSGRFDWVFEKGAKVRLLFEGTSQGRETGLSGALDCSAPQAGIVLACARIETDRELSVKTTAPDGAPVVGAVVEATGYSWDQPRTAMTDEAGVARFENLPARALDVRARATDKFARSAGVSATPAGQQVVVALRKGVAVRGVVVQADGAPAKADVTIWRDGEPMGTVATDTEGKFALLVAADVEGEIDVGARGESGGGHVDDVAPGSEVRIVLGR
jgi:hypothetical protein